MTGFHNHLAVQPVFFHLADFRSQAIDKRAHHNLDGQSQFVYALGIVSREGYLRKHHRLSNIVAVTLIEGEGIAVKVRERLENLIDRVLHHDGIEHAAMQQQASVAGIIVCNNFTHTESDKVLVGGIGERLHTHEGWQPSPRTVDTVGSLGFRSGKAQLQVRRGARFLQVLDQRRRHGNLHEGILCINGKFIRGIGGIVRLPFHEAFTPGGIRDVLDAIDKSLRLALTHIELPFHLQVERFLVRERIGREVLCRIERIEHEQGNERRRGIRFGQRIDESRIPERDIENEIVREPCLRAEDCPVVCRENGPARKRLRRHRSQVFYSNSLDLVAIGQALVSKPAAERRILGIEQARRQR